MRDKLRKRYQVSKEMAQKGSFEGEIPLAELERLRELLYPDRKTGETGSVFLQFEFLRSEFDIPMITGRLQTRLDLECQRCLKPLGFPLELDFRLMIDASDDLLRNSSMDTLYSDDGCIDIAEVIEDELILAIPLVSMHENTACNENWQTSESKLEPAVKENPFAVLQQLKTTD